MTSYLEFSYLYLKVKGVKIGKNSIDIGSILVLKNRNFKAPNLAMTILDNNLENELLAFALSNDSLISNRAMWVLSHCHDLDSDRIKPFYNTLINHLKNDNLQEGVIRSILKIFQTSAVPKKHESFMIDICYNYFKSKSNAIAIRVFSISVIFNIAKQYSELLNELLVVLNQFSHEKNGPAIDCRIKSIRKKINRLI